MTLYHNVAVKMVCYFISILKCVRQNGKLTKGLGTYFFGKNFRHVPFLEPMLQNFFYSQLKNGPNKLVCLSLAGLSSLI
jgi:hypothetical protein